MIEERRNDFKSWFRDVGYIYLVVAALVVAYFAVTGLEDFAEIFADAADKKPGVGPTYNNN